jgi:hypothetical protein
MKHLIFDTERGKVMKFPRATIAIGQCLAPKSFVLKDYGRIKINGLRWMTHRLSYHLNVARISRKPNKKKTNWILHHCDNKWCINPEHLYLGTPKDNAIDNAERNREWRRNRSLVQKRLGPPVVSSTARKEAGRKNSVLMKKRWKEKREIMLAIAFNRRKNELHETSCV